MRVTEQYELDAQKSLQQLRREWDGCMRCASGERRANLDTRMVHGEGVKRGIMLVGEGPGETEEAMGRPFVGKSGYLLREVLRALNIEDLVYITNIVACRSAIQRMDNDGQPMFIRRGKGPPLPRWEDVPPPKASVEACWPRFHQELYIVDPIVIVAMGNPAVEALLGHSVSITKARGQVEEVSVPGVGYKPSLTDKKAAWIRSYSKESGFVMPVAPNDVCYTMVPTLHPAFVLRKARDDSNDSPFKQFTDDVRLAVRTYERYMLEVHNTVPTCNSNAEVTYDTEDDDQEAGG